METAKNAANKNKIYKRRKACYAFVNDTAALWTESRVITLSGASIALKNFIIRSFSVPSISIPSNLDTFCHKRVFIILCRLKKLKEFHLKLAERSLDFNFLNIISGTRQQFEQRHTKAQVRNNHETERESRRNSSRLRNPQDPQLRRK